MRMPVCRRSSKALLSRIVAPQQFLLDQLVVFGSQWPRQDTGRGLGYRRSGPKPSAGLRAGPLWSRPVLRGIRRNGRMT